MDHEQITALISQLTLEEKAALTSGRDNWFTKAVDRLGIPPARTSDGPHGLRTQVGESNSFQESDAVPAVCFPAACTAAASFDRSLLYEMGAALGRECQALGVNVLLGPGVNMKRTPLCGRNFEYFSEDPLLAGELGAAFVNGVQSEGVGACLKHFFANNQEYRRSDVSVGVDERTMREIYLRAFETVIKKAQPWAVMASYNKVGSVYSTANKEAITDILRNEWGFKGLVMSDWGATHDRAEAIAAGCDLTMPAEDTDGEIVKAVQEGRLAETDLDACCGRIVSLALRADELHREDVDFDYTDDYALARKIAAESIVLLKNEVGLLPLAETQTVAFIGPFAQSLRYQGGGSSHINSRKTVSAVECAKARNLPVVCAQGCDANGETNDALLAEAVQAAASAQAAVVFVGLTDAMETEGVDRRHMRLPEGHNALVEAVCAANPNTVVVLHNGSPVELPWAERPKAILEAYLGGDAVGEAVVDILYGREDPSGRLPESFPVKLEDNPSYLFYPGESGVVNYHEGLFVGYRYYETKRMAVRYPFGYGLSYTRFQFSDLRLDKASIQEGENITAQVTVTKSGERAGKAVVQLYIAPEQGGVPYPVRELKDFAKVDLAPGESKTLSFTLDSRAFAHWNPAAKGWRIDGGRYKVQIGENARDILLEQAVDIEAEPVPPAGGYDLNAPMSLFAKSPRGREFLNQNTHLMIRGMAAAGFMPKELLAALEQLGPEPDLTALGGFFQSMGSADGLETLFEQPLSILDAFLPPDRKEKLRGLLAALNQ